MQRYLQAALAIVLTAGTTQAGVVFWSTMQGHSIVRLEANLVNSRVFQTGMTTAALAVDRRNSKMYWSDGNRIWRASMDPFHIFNFQPMMAAVGSRSMTISGSSLYWTEAGSFSIQRSNLDGSGRVTLVAGAGTPFGVAVDQAGGHLYWSDQAGHAIKRSNLDGSGVTTILSGLADPREVAVDAAHGNLYWADASQGIIHRSDLLGGNVIDLVTGQVGAQGVAVDAPNGKVYWTALGDRTVRRVNFDGSGMIVLGNSPSGLWDVTLIPSPGAGTLLLGGGLMAWRRRRM